jgi:hypothetical protein
MTKKPGTKKATAKKATAKKATAKKATAKKATAKKATAKKAPAKKAREEGASEARHGRRADYGSSLEPYMQSLVPEQRAIVSELRAIIAEAIPGVQESIRWGVPVFATDRLLCYASPKARYVRFGFYDRDITLDDPEGELQGSMPHIKLERVDDIDRGRILGWVQAVAAHVPAARAKQKRAVKAEA